MKMKRYRTKKKLMDAFFSPESLDYDNLVSHCLHINWNRRPNLFLREVKHTDLNVETTRLMGQLLRMKRWKG
jgi:hypothetical protein